MPPKKRKRAAIPPDPPGFKPVTRDDMTDPRAVERLVQQLGVDMGVSFEQVTFRLDAILERFDRIERHVENVDQRSLATDRRVDEHAKRLGEHDKELAEVKQRIERLEGAKKGQEP